MTTLIAIFQWAVTLLTKDSESGKRQPNGAGVLLMVAALLTCGYGGYAFASGFMAEVNRTVHEAPLQAKRLDGVVTRLDRLEERDREQSWEQRQIRRMVEALLIDRGISPARVKAQEPRPTQDPE